jgi:hypothetical protein
MQLVSSPANMVAVGRQPGSAWGPVTLPVFKTGGRRLSAATVGSTPTRFRHFFNSLRECKSLANQLDFQSAILIP